MKSATYVCPHMEKKYGYFKRDISWLSFNYRVLLEAADATLPIYERIRFLSIYASNLEEFYEIRVADQRGAIMKKNYRADNSEKAEETLNEITAEVNRQQQDFYSIFNDGILPELRRQRVYLYQTHEPLPFHRDFVRRYFDEEIFPYLSPVTLHEGFRTFIRDRRLYLIARILKRETREPLYVLIKIPHSNVPRFIALPEHEGMHYFMFVDDMIRYNLPAIFPGYVPDGCYGIKISRDADIYVDEETPQSILQSIRTKVGKRKIGALSRFMYDREMPPDVLAFVRRSFHIAADDLVGGGRYMNLQDMIRLPNPIGAELVRTPPAPLRVPYLEELASMFRAVERGDVLLHFPYQSFDYLLRFLMEASFDPDVEEIKITQYRVAENSAVIHSLIGAARNGKRVTVFVELKARFDEENNMSTAEEMRQAGIKIIYSIPGLKVHAKVAVVLRRGEAADFACLSTGNFNEKTAKGYSDMALLTCDKAIVGDVCRVFEVLEGRLAEPHFVRLLVARFNMVPELIRLIRREADLARAGRGGRIILKMNGLQDKQMIDELYEAGQAGVEIDLLVRGICCLTPDRSYSPNIRVTRIVDMYLEHARLWYFRGDGEETMYLTSSDWMRRNLNRRIEAAVPILSPDVRREILDILDIQLRDNVKACHIDGQLRNIYIHNDAPPLRAQQATYEYIKRRTHPE